MPQILIWAIVFSEERIKLSATEISTWVAMVAEAV